MTIAETIETTESQELDFLSQQKDLKLDPRVFPVEVLSLLEEYSFDLSEVPPRDIVDKNSTPTAISMDINGGKLAHGYIMESEELNEVVFVKTFPRFKVPLVSLSFCFRDSYNRFKNLAFAESEDWEALFLESRLHQRSEANERFVNFLERYLFILNSSRCQISVETYDEKREKGYKRYIRRFPYPELFSIRRVSQG